MRVVKSLPDDVAFADAEYPKIEFPLIEATADLPAVMGSFHDPEFARSAFEFLQSKDAMTLDDYVALAQEKRSSAFTMSGVENTDLLTSVKDRLAEIVVSIRAIDAQWGHFSNTVLWPESDDTSFAAVVQITKAIRAALAVEAANANGGAG